MNKVIENILKIIPKSPGVYKMKDDEGRVLYVGKAKNLRNRVRSYFQKSSNHSVRTKKMVSQIQDIEYIVVDSELEALILETNLIKELRPKYNILMKDDKNYVYIKVTTNEDFPRISVVRQIEKDGAKYFGPKTSAQRTTHTLKTLKKIFPYRHCNLNIDFLPNAKTDPYNKLTLKKRVNCTNININIPCLDYHIKRCIAPCIGIPTPEEYREIIDQVISFLEGKTDQVIQRLQEKMKKAASLKKFELAARIRDKILTVESILEKQKISDPNQKNTDIINFATKDNRAFFNVFLIRDGKLINQETFILDLPNHDTTEISSDDDNPEILQSFLQQYYEKAADIGKEILIPTEIPEQKPLSQFLSQLRGNKVSLIIPQKGKKNKLLELALKNAKIHADRTKTSWEKEEENLTEALKELQSQLKLSKQPKRIECYDISHFAGKNTVASMVVFENGRPKNKDYRQFKINSLPTNKSDDYRSLAEALTRRLQYLIPKSNLPKNISLEKPKKKDLPEIEQIIKDNPKISNENFDYKKTLILKKKDKIIGLGRIKEHEASPKPIEEISSLWIDPKHRGQKLGIALLNALLKKTKTKRIYLGTFKNLESYYTQAGFRLIHKIPSQFEKQTERIRHELKTKPIYMVFDKNQQTDHSFKQKPDLILIDGGKGQLSTIAKVLTDLNLESIGLASIAKREEEIFTRELKSPIPLDKTSHAQRILERARDEAHRFANAYREKLQSKDLTQSALDQIPGLGPKTRTKLLKEFGSISGIKSAPIEKISTITGPKLAEKILKHL